MTNLLLMLFAIWVVAAGIWYELYAIHKTLKQRSKDND